jgi:hypothetical protein
LLAQLHERFGNTWTKLAPFFSGRTDNCIKNRWNSTVKKRLERMKTGQPLVMKRGRKPRLPASPDENSQCPSPGDAMPTLVPFEHIPLHPLLRAKFGLPAPRCEITSLEESRRVLRQLLNAPHD